MKNVNEVLDTLKAYNFHDMPLDSLEFKTEDSETQLILHLLEYNEKTKDYDNVKLNFIDIQKLESTKIFLTKDSYMEIFSFDCELTDNFDCKLLILMGFGEPSLEIKLTCLNIEFIT